MQLKTGILTLALAVSAAPLSAQISRGDPRDRRPTSTSGTISDIIFGSGTDTTSRRGTCRVRDAVTPDGRVVQICDDRRARRDDDDDDRGHGERGARGTRHVNDRDGDGDFDANDRAIRKREHEQAKQQRKLEKERLKLEKKRVKAARKADRRDD